MAAKTLDMMNLEEITEVYLCNKYGKDPVKCLDCPKHENCPVGGRVIELLNEMTEAKNIPKWIKGSLAAKKNARHRAAEVLAHEDPLKYLISTGLSVNTARIRLRRYKKAYPDLFEEKNINSNMKTSRNDGESEADYNEAKASDDQVGFYMNKYGLTRDAAQHRWKYNNAKFENKETKKEESSMVNDKMEPEEEISLDDFLKSHEVKTEPESPEGMPYDKDSLITLKEYKEICKEAEKGDPITDKYTELILERDELTAKLKKCCEAINAFELVMDILNND